MICLILSYRKNYLGEVECSKGNCAWTDERGRCLIGKALTNINTILESHIKPIQEEEEEMYTSFIEHLLKSASSITKEEK